MHLRRRSLLAMTGALVATGARADDTDAYMSERSFGHPDAPVVVTEYFSLTCTHCAAFSREVMPEITEKLVNTGKVRFVYKDFPLDQVALVAAMVARALPADRYEPFISALFASQDRWAFNKANKPTDELAKMALLAGMTKTTFDVTVANEGLRNAILAAQKQAENDHHINSTPTFISKDTTHPGAMRFDDFVKFSGASV